MKQLSDTVYFALAVITIAVIYAIVTNGWDLMTAIAEILGG